MSNKVSHPESYFTIKYSTLLFCKAIMRTKMLLLILME